MHGDTQRRALSYVALRCVAAPDAVWTQLNSKNVGVSVRACTSALTYDRTSGHGNYYTVEIEDGRPAVVMVQLSWCDHTERWTYVCACTVHNRHVALNIIETYKIVSGKHQPDVAPTLYKASLHELEEMIWDLKSLV